ncbi:unnamed protein product [Victoria cruziana]
MGTSTLPDRPRLRPSNLFPCFSAPAMAQVRRRVAVSRAHARWLGIVGQVYLLRRVIRYLRDNILACAGKPRSYQRLPRTSSCSSFEQLPDENRDGGAAGCGGADDPPVAEPPTGGDTEADSDTVVLKVTVLGDCQIGKTTFVVKYVGEGEERSCLQTTGLNQMDKVLLVQGAKIAFNLWDVGGENQFVDHVGLACKDAAAILIMFDLTNRCTLNSVVGWYRQARRWNRAAIPVLIGTKFDDFVGLPLDVQWTIVSQARTYAHAMKATLFFSSATHNINVNKIFKFITAKLFNLPWTIERNLTIGEPIIDF